MLTAIIVVLQVLSSLALIFLILMHSGKGGGLSDMFGGSVGSAGGRFDGGREEPGPDHRHRGRDLRVHQSDPDPASAVSPTGAEPVERRQRIASLWREYRARWTLPLVIIVIIGLVAVVDHLGSHRISQVDQATTSVLVAASGGQATVALDRPWAGFNPNTAAGSASSTPTLLASVLPSAYVVNPKLVPQVNSDLLLSVEATSTSPLVVQYIINPQAVWSDGVPVSADDFIYAWQSQQGDGVDVDGQSDQIASNLGYRDVGVDRAAATGARRSR